MELLKADKLTYHNGNKSILNDSHFRILEGEKYALIGPNGAGKTTLIKILTSELEPDSGTLTRSPSLRISVVSQIPEIRKGQTLS